MPKIKKEESTKKIEKAIAGITADFNRNHPMLNVENIAKKYKISVGTVSKIIIPKLQALGIIEIEKRRAGYYYNPNHTK